MRPCARLTARHAVVSIEIEQIENEVDQPIGVPFRERAAQCLEVGQSGIAKYRCFAVDDEVVPRKRFGRIRDLVEVISPIVAAARIDGDPPVMDMHLRAIAVDLDFVQPPRTFRRAIAQARVARRDEWARASHPEQEQQERGRSDASAQRRTCGVNPV